MMFAGRCWYGLFGQCAAILDDETHWALLVSFGHLQANRLQGGCTSKVFFVVEEQAVRCIERDFGAVWMLKERSWQDCVALKNVVNLRKHFGFPLPWLKKLSFKPIYFMAVTKNALCSWQLANKVLFHHHCMWNPPFPLTCWSQKSNISPKKNDGNHTQQYKTLARNHKTHEATYVLDGFIDGDESRNCRLGWKSIFQAAWSALDRSGSVKESLIFRYFAVNIMSNTSPLEFSLWNGGIHIIPLKPIFFFNSIASHTKWSYRKRDLSLFVCLLACLFACLFVCLFVRLFVCLFVCLWCVCFHNDEGILGHPLNMTWIYIDVMHYMW